MKTKQLKKLIGERKIHYACDACSAMVVIRYRNKYGMNVCRKCIREELQSGHTIGEPFEAPETHTETHERAENTITSYARNRKRSRAPWRPKAR